MGFKMKGFPMIDGTKGHSVAKQTAVEKAEESAELRAWEPSAADSTIMAGHEEKIDAFNKSVSELELTPEQGEKVKSYFEGLKGDYDATVDSINAANTAELAEHNKLVNEANAEIDAKNAQKKKEADDFIKSIAPQKTAAEKVEESAELRPWEWSAADSTIMAGHDQKVSDFQNKVAEFQLTPDQEEKVKSHFEGIKGDAQADLDSINAANMAEVAAHNKLVVQANEEAEAERKKKSKEADDFIKSLGN